MRLKVGDKAPLFTAQDNLDNLFESQSLIGYKPVIIYFYPKDDTPGCTTQACSFRDQYQDFKDLGAEVIGISSDNLKSHQSFVTKYNLPFLLLSDENQKIRNRKLIINNHKTKKTKPKIRKNNNKKTKQIITFQKNKDSKSNGKKTQ